MSKIAFMFPGQGAQYVGMMRDIAEAYPVSAEVFCQANRILGRDISRLTFQGPDVELDRTVNTQPCLLTAEISVLRAVEAAGIQPAAFLGFSLGEWSTLVAASVLPFEQALSLVQLRAQAMQRAAPAGKGGMAVILGKTKEEVQSLCDRAEDYVVPSNYNCPGQISVAGSVTGIENLMILAEKEGILAKRIQVSVPSHCELMAPAADELRSVIERVSFAKASRPIIMNCCGMAVTDASEIKRNMLRQLTEPVHMEESIKVLLQDDFDTFIELGPGKTLSGFVRKTAKAQNLTVHTYAIKDLVALHETIDIINGGGSCVE